MSLCFPRRADFSSKMDIGPILFLDTEETWRGGEQQVLCLVRAALARGSDAQVATAEGGELSARLRGECPVVSARMRGDFEFVRLVPRLVACCIRKKIRLLDAHNSRGHLLGFAVKVFLPRLRLVVHRHVDFAPARNVVNRLIYQSSVVDRFVAVSDRVGAVLRDFGVGSERIRVVKSAVDGSAFQNRDRGACRHRLLAEFGIPVNSVLIGAVGHLTPQKDHKTLVESLRILWEREIDFHCLVAGAGNLKQDVERQVERSGLGSRVTLLGFRRDIPELLAGLDIFVMPSAMEGLGTAVQEACHAGICVVATSAGGIPEIISHEETGLLSRPGDPASLAANLCRAISDVNLRDRLAACARQSVAARFPFGKFIEDSFAIYREVQTKRQ